jgi:hypothetical protein
MVRPISSDVRLFRNQASSVKGPVRFQSFLVGGLMAYDVEVFDSFHSALQRFIVGYHLP